MRNPHGSFIWYELLTDDTAAASDFYAGLIGWTATGMPGMPYTIWTAGNAGVGGMMALSDIPGTTMRPGWLGYIGVDDVDARVAAIVADGGTVRMPAMDLPDVGRIALVADPQGIAFYVMRGAIDRPSGAFDPKADGRCGWNELSTPDREAALAFYGRQFGWEKAGAMPMGELGEYAFIGHHGDVIGAVMTTPSGGPPPAWSFYFRVPDIDRAAAFVAENGGTVHHGPSEVPGGDWIIVASDPQGAAVGLVGAKR